MKKQLQRTGLAIFGSVVLWLSAHSAAVARDDWAFAVAPYAWLSGVSGSVATLPPLPPADLDMSFSDVLEDLDGAFFVTGEARNDRFVLLADLVYTNISTDDPYAGALFNGVRTRQKNLLLAGLGGYRVVDDPKFKIDVLGGFRFWSIDSNLTLTSNVIAERRIDHDESWVDPVAGARLILPLAERWQFGATGGIGGIAFGADLEWDLIATVQYRVADWAWIGGGYRHLSVDYRNDGFVYDIDQSGPLLGASFRF